MENAPAGLDLATVRDGLLARRDDRDGTGYVLP